MTTSEINNSLIGKKVKGIFTALPVTGTIISTFEDKYMAGVEIELDVPVIWGDHTYKTYTSASRKIDEFGNLELTELI